MLLNYFAAAVVVIFAEVYAAECVAPNTNSVDVMGMIFTVGQSLISNNYQALCRTQGAGGSLPDKCAHTCPRCAIN
jgi:hypothetical protein